MSTNTTEDDNLPSPALDVMDSPRKRMRLENSPRKSWSLMDRRADKEVLQEMGVSLLEPDEGDPSCDTASTNNAHKSNLKRKRDIENVNPNINSIIMSPRGKYSPKSPRGKFSPSPGPSRVKSPRSSEKLKPLQPSDQILETSVSHAYLVDEETPLAQSVSADYKGFNAGTSSGKKRISDNSFTRHSLEEDQRVHPTEPSIRQDDVTDGADTFSLLSDEVILGVMRWLPKRTLAHCMLVCKRWYRIACTETLWQRLDLGNKTLAKDSLGRILDRKPVIVRFASSEIGEWRPTSTPIQSRIQYLDLSMCTIEHQTLEQLLARCSGLRKLSLESVNLSEPTQELIGKCGNMETLNLTMAQGLTVEGLTAILEGCTALQSLNISWCNLNEDALQILVELLPQKLQRLNLGGARTLTDDMVAALVSRCPRLLELDLSDCSRLAVASLTALLSLSRLEHLALSRCYLLPPHALTKLRSMAALQYLEVWGMLPTASTNALRAALPAIQINQFKFSAISRPTVGTRRTSIWGLRTRD
ncbi:S-phase kinase-associated protein 2 [Maniola hyperantus]|uniref:S-phase kinase-associated protein 2 n=1 Tax=Aphantopus hyperantus TaxID=2795564 RepID=UPI001568B14F|nr:S-phase kinase-associated protein 2 [Maniola hyperantus]